MGIAAAAARTGLTRRALRHYESLGLVHPSARRGGYFRQYSARDVRRLERIAALQRLLGLTLEQVGSVLGAEDLTQASQRAQPPQLGAAAAVIKRHLALLQERVEALESLRERYERLLVELACEAGGGAPAGGRPRSRPRPAERTQAER